MVMEPVRALPTDRAPRPAPHQHTYRRYQGRVLCDTAGCRAELVVPVEAYRSWLPSGVVIRQGGRPGGLWCIHGVFCGLEDYAKSCPVCAGTPLPPTLQDDVEDLRLALMGLWVATCEVAKASATQGLRRVAQFLSARGIG